jgi:outer membrane protein assembly factor BamB
MATRRHRVGRICVIVVVATVATACDWTGFGFDAAHTRATAEAGPPMPMPNLLSHIWTGTTDGVIESSPVTAGDTVFVTTRSGRLDAFAATVSTETPGCDWNTVCPPEWSAAIAPSSSTPIVDQGVVYVGSDDGTVRAFDAAGRQGCGGTPTVCTARWRTEVRGSIVASPQIVGDTLYVGSTNGDLSAYDARGVRNCATGICSPLWRAPLGGPVRSSPAVADGVVYVGADDGRLSAIDALGAANCTAGVCRPLWSAATGGPIRSSPAVASGVVYIGSDDGTLDAFDAAGTTNCADTPRVCTPLWSAATGGPVVSAPAIAQGRVVVGSDDGTIRAYDAAGRQGCSGSPVTCTPLWRGAMRGPVRGSPAIAGSIVYAGASGGHIAAFDLFGSRGCTGAPAVCLPLWSRALGTAVSAPTVSGSKVFVGADALHAYRVLVNPAATGLDAAALTSDGADTYGIDLPGGDRASVHANAGNAGGNTRVVARRPRDGVGTDLESCATWTSDAGRHDQEGAALRVHDIVGGVKAITVTKNIVFGANWIFNVHVWDTSRSPVATQIGDFDLASAFFPSGQLIPLPWTMCARVIGSTVSFVVWPTSESRPPWNDATHGGSVTLPPGFGAAGAAGWYVGHLEADDRAEFADLQAGPLPTAGAGAAADGVAPSSTARPPTSIRNLP